MPLLAPKINDPILDILSDTGIISAPSAKSSRLKSILETNGLSLEDVVGELSNIALRSEKEETKLKAIDTALRMHGVMQPDAVKEAPTIVFKIESDNVNLNQIIAPIR